MAPKLSCMSKSFKPKIRNNISKIVVDHERQKAYVALKTTAGNTMKTQDNDPNTDLINAAKLYGMVKGYVFGFISGSVVMGIICLLSK